MSLMDNMKICLHCQREFNSAKEEWFCCSGCKVVYEFINLQKLENYYQNLRLLNESLSPLVDQETQEDLTSYGESSLLPIFLKNKQVYSFFIPSIKCSACMWLIERLALKLPTITLFNVNLLDKTIDFSIAAHDEQQKSQTLFQFATLLKNCGYRPYPYSLTGTFETEAQIQKARLKDIAIMGFAAGNIMLFSISNYFGNTFGIGEKFRRSFDVLSMIIAIPAIGYGARSFFTHAFASLKNRIFHIDLPLSIAIILGIFTSSLNVFLKNNYVYFDTLTCLVFFLLIGRYFQDALLLKNKKMGNFLGNLLPKESFTLKKDQIITVPVGKIIPADGVILEGSSEINQAIVSGEHLSVVKKAGDSVLAGTQNITCPLVIQVQKAGMDTFLSRIKELVEKAQADKTRLSSVMEKVTGVFTVCVLGIALLDGFYWYFVDPSKILETCTAILIVSCPCALALAPALITTSAIRRLWEEGVIVKSPESLEALTHIDAAVLDKTGTLTNPNLQVESVENARDDDLKIIACMAQYSLHHVAKVLYRTYCDPDFYIKLTDIQEIPGQGIQASVEGYKQPFRIGNEQFVGITRRESSDKFLVYAQCCDHIVRFSLVEELNKGADEFIHYLNKRRLPYYLLSGDNDLSVKKIANSLAIPMEHIFAQLSPQDKLNFLTSRLEKKKVLALGDGVNDAAMLARAQVGIAVYGGIDASLNAADIFLVKKDLGLVIKTMDFCFYTRDTFWFILVVNVIYNACVISFACWGKVNPLVAAILMPLSSLCVYLISYFRDGKKIWI